MGSVSTGRSFQYLCRCSK